MNDSIDDGNPHRDEDRLRPNANPPRIQDEDELRRWFALGRSHAWMSEEYERRYNITTTPTLWGNVRRRLGLAAVTERDSALMPWPVLPQHRWSYFLALLRMEVRRRAGVRLSTPDADRLDALKRRLAEGDLVVAYDPQTADGFALVPRRAGVDLDLIREPDAE